jgi:hypothetical protein
LAIANEILLKVDCKKQPLLLLLTGEEGKLTPAGVVGTTETEDFEDGRDEKFSLEEVGTEAVGCKIRPVDAPL